MSEALTLPREVQVKDGETALGPQAGPQTEFMRSRARIVVYGGSASGGKSWGLLYSASRFAARQPVKGYGAVIFRRETKQITQEGGLWDESQILYALMGGKPYRTPPYRWEWPRYGTKVSFNHLHEEKDKTAYQGAQIPFIGWDELTHFSEDQFFYLFSRNRSTCGVTPRVRATCNPDSESWVKNFLSPWVDDSYPLPAKSGEIRWFVRDGSAIRWLKPGEYDSEAISVTFIAATIYDNPIFMKANPGYINTLKALNYVDRRRLLFGDWNIRKAGNKFKRVWFGELVDNPPVEFEKVVRFWDLAATEVSESSPDPDFTAGVKVGKGKDGFYYVLHVVYDRLSPLKVETLIKTTADSDGKKCTVWIEQEPGASGVNTVTHYRLRVLQGFPFYASKHVTDKEARANPVSSMAEGGGIKVVRGYWNDAFFSNVESFPTKGIHDDITDAFCGAFEQLTNKKEAGLVMPKPKQDKQPVMVAEQEDSVSWW